MTEFATRKLPILLDNKEITEDTPRDKVLLHVAIQMTRAGFRIADFIDEGTLRLSDGDSETFRDTYFPQLDPSICLEPRELKLMVVQRNECLPPSQDNSRTVAAGIVGRSLSEERFRVYGRGMMMQENEPVKVISGWAVIAVI